MSYEVKFDQPPAGISMSAARDGESIVICQTDFTSTEDGQVFIQRLEGFVDKILTLLRPQLSLRPSDVDHILAVIYRDGTTTVYVNEIKQVVSVRINRACEAGEAISKNDIVEFDRFCLDGIDIPDTCGVLYLFSVGWRKGLFFDFAPLTPDADSREFDCESLFGQLHGYVLFQERFAISETEWSALFNSKWFPFAALRHDTIESLLSHIRSGWDPDELADKIIEEVHERLDGFIEVWQKYETFQSHIEILTHAADRFRAKDYISCAGLLYPRIEGVLRSHLLAQQSSTRATQNAIAETAVVRKVQNQHSLLLPQRFQQYLQKVYFANFNPVAQQIDVSRNSVAHGVADQSSFSKKSAVIALLVIHQLFYSFGAAPVAVEMASESPSE